MWIHWSVTRLVRWRVRDWASCFTACRFPLDDETEAYRSSSGQVHYVKNMAGKKRGERGISNSISVGDTNNNNENGDSSCWPSFADEDYIVFCFNEDGAFDVVEDCRSEAGSHIDAAASGRRRRRSSWPVNQKISNCEDARTGSNVTHDSEIIAVKEAEEDEEEEKESSFMDAAESPSSRMQNEEMVWAAGSSDSCQSDNSTGSFAFPVLGWEWVGSPAQWPKSKGLHLRKNKPCSLTFHCCRF